MTDEKQTNNGYTVWKPIGGNNPDTIGGNSHSYMYTDEKGQTQTIIVDLGSLFCDEKKTGYCNIIPDARVHFDKIDGSEKSKLPASAIFLTHGHQDHIGGLPHMIKMGYKLPPIVATKLTLEYVKQTFQSQWVKKEDWPELKEIAPDNKVEIGNFVIEPVAVSHSMPNAVGYSIKTPDAHIVHTGDFKTDTTVPVGRPFDKKRFIELGKEEVNAVMVDSTSIFREGKIVAEEKIFKNILKAVEENPDSRIVIPIISSSTQRLASIARAAVATGKTIILEGASLVNSEKALRNAGISIAEIAGFQEGEIIDVNGRATARKLIAKGGSAYADSLDDSDKIVVCTGTQGEEVASFYKAINYNLISEEAQVAQQGKRENPFVLNKDDVVMMAQSAIPGNERAYYKVLENAVTKIGAKVYVPVLPEDKKLASLFELRDIHASGHGGKGDLKVLYDALTKKSKKKGLVVVPVHGAKKQIAENAKFAASLGLKTSEHLNYEGLRISKDGVFPVDLKVGAKGLEIVAQEKNTPREKTYWIGLRSTTNDWLKPFYDYESIDGKYNKIKIIQKDNIGERIAKKQALEATRDRYRKSGTNNNVVKNVVLNKRFWIDRD